MNKDQEKLYQLIGKCEQAEVKVDQAEIDRVYAKTMAKIKMEEKKQSPRVNKRKYRLLLIAAALILMNMSAWAVHEHIFKDFNYIFTRQQGGEGNSVSNDKEEAFSDKDEKQMEEMGKIVAQKVSNGLDVTLSKVVGDSNNLYMIFDVEDPTETIDFTKLEDKPMHFYDSCILFPETGGESGGWCDEIIEKRTPHKAQFMMECAATDELTGKKVSVILKDLLAEYDEDIQPLKMDEKDLTKLYKLIGSEEDWMDRKQANKLENVIHVMDGSRLEQISMMGDQITFYFDVPYRTTDIYLIDSIALRNKETGEIKAPRYEGQMQYSDPNSKFRGKDFTFEGITKELLDKWELVTGYERYYTMISPGGWHFGLEVDFVDHTKSIGVDEVLELRSKEFDETYRYHINEVNLSGVSITLVGTNLGASTLYGFEGKLVMKNGDEVKFVIGKGSGAGELHLSATLPYLIDVEEVQEIIFESGLHINVDEAAK